MIEKTHSEVLTYEKALDKTKLKIEEVGREWNTVDTISQRIAALETQLGEMDARIDGTLKKVKDVEASETKLKDVNALIEDTRKKEEQIYKYRTELDSMKKSIDAFVTDTAVLEQKMKELKSQEQDVTLMAKRSTS